MLLLSLMMMLVTMMMAVMIPTMKALSPLASLLQTPGNNFFYDGWMSLMTAIMMTM